MIAGLFSDDIEQESITQFLHEPRGGAVEGPSGPLSDVLNVKLRKGGKGGGGRGGGGSRGGTGSRGPRWYGGSHYGSRGGGGSALPTWAWVLLGSVLSLLAFLCLFIMCKKKEKNSSDSGYSRPGSDAGFEEAVSNAREKLITAGDLEAAAAADFETYKGSFKVKYKDRGNILDGTAQLRLEDDGGGAYRVEGECIDADGMARIAEGRVSRSGRAWWVEETLSGPNEGLRVLTEGRFDFGTDAFDGTWRVSSGIRGAYTLFVGSNVSKTFRPHGAMASPVGALQGMLRENVPLAETTMEAPLLGVAPPIVHAVPETNLPSAKAPEPYVPRF